jgi:lipopolysaccharide transport system permease protein
MQVEGLKERRNELTKVQADAKSVASAALGAWSEADSLAMVPPLKQVDAHSDAELRNGSVTIIKPEGGWRLLDIEELWKNRELLYFLALRDVKVRYKQTLLGVAWAVLQPALMMVVFTIFFSRMAGVASGGLPYPLFAYAGLLPWTFFATALANASNSVVGSERLITKIYFPRLIVPLASIGAALVDFVIGLGLLFLLLLGFGRTPSMSILLIPVLTVLIMTAATGLGVLLAALNVAYRDVRYVVPFMIQLGMFATPSVYMQVRYDSSPLMTAVCLLNPMTTLVDCFRAASVGGEISWPHLALASGLSLVLLVGGCFYFRRVESGFADIV